MASVNSLAVKEPIWFKLGMSKLAKPARRATQPAKRFTPVPRTCVRHDGWTPAKQSAFIDALAESGCVHEACRAVGLSRTSTSALRTRADAQGFRLAWDAALDVAIRRLADECFSRAIHGEVVPRFYRGEQVGEHRRYDHKLAMFLLRYRDPLRYAATLDQMVYTGHPEAAAINLARAQNRMMDEAHGVFERAEPPTPAYEAEPVAVARQRQVETAIATSNCTIHGSDDRRDRIQAIRTEHVMARYKEEEEAFAAARAAELDALRTPATASTLSTSEPEPCTPQPSAELSWPSPSRVPSPRVSNWT